jgi:hypothetical protein
MNDGDEDVIWRGIDRRVDELEDAVVARMSQRPRALPQRPNAIRTQTLSAFPIGLALAVAAVAVLAGGVLIGGRPVGQLGDILSPASGSPDRSFSPRPEATPVPTASLEILTGEGDGDHLISQRMGWTCRWGADASRVLPDLAAVDRAADEQRVTEGWVDVTLFRQPSRIWIGDDVVAAALAHAATLLATGTRGDHWILVHRDGRDMAVQLGPHRTPAGRTAWLEGNSTGPCPASTESADALPLDPAVKPVSISSASADEQRALDMCISFTFRVEDVAGMGKIPRARDAYKYVPLTGREPDLKNDRPAWIVAFQGELRLPRRAERAKDPICLITELEPSPMFMLPWGTVDNPSFLEHLKRVYRLPPLQP